MRTFNAQNVHGKLLYKNTVNRLSTVNSKLLFVKAVDIMKEKNVNLKRKPPKPKPREKIVFEKCKYAVIKFIDYKSKLFESIPESWFVNEEKTACYWPPKTGRSFKLRALNQDAPDWDWVIYECIVVSEGHGKY